MADGAPSPDVARMLAEAGELDVQLKDAEQGVQDADRELAATARDRETAADELATKLERVECDHIRAVTDRMSHGTQYALKKAIEFRDEAEPSLTVEDFERVLELERHLQEAAGQPVMVFHPAKGEVEIGMLRSFEGEDSIHLKVEHRTRPNRGTIELPTMSGFVRVDTDTGASQGPTAFGGLPGAREVVPPRPTVPDLFQAAFVDRPDGIPTEDLSENAAFIVTGFENLHAELNRYVTMRGQHSEMREAGAELLTDRLHEICVDFDPAFLSGYLEARIERLREESADSHYHQSEIRTLEAKRAILIEDGWIEE